MPDALLRSACLANPYGKAARAEEHLDRLKREVAAFVESKPYTIRSEDDMVRQEFKIWISFSDVPESVWLTFGDFISCLRASLDHLIFCLAKLKPGNSYPERTEFPIIEKCNSEAMKRFSRAVEGVPEGAIRIIQEVQPYHAGNDVALHSHLLWKLHELSNIDKHRRIPIGEYTFATNNLAPAWMVKHATSRDHDPNEFEIAVPLALKGSVNLNPEISFAIVFGDKTKGIACALADMEAIHSFVADNLLPRFLRFF